MIFVKRPAVSAGGLLLAAALLLQGCGVGRANPPASGAPPEVGVVTIEPRSLPLQTELPGRTSAFAVSDVRPQVSGIIKARLFTEGGLVRAGQLLYQIDPSTYQAACDQAKAQLASAQANLDTARLKAERYADLVKIDAVSKQEADDAKAAYEQAAANVQQQTAAVHSATINLDFTRVTAPISGRIGRSNVTQGALVTANQAAALATIQQLDPLYVDLTQSASDVIRLRRDLARTAAARGGAPVRLRLEDGSDYPIAGRLQFADVTVDPASGAVTLRAVFPNPGDQLLPGLFVRALVTEGAMPDALLAPQQGVARDAKGQAVAMVVGADGRAEARVLKTGRAIGDQWLVLDGLRSGDRLIVEGLQNVRPGAPVRAVAAGAAR